MEYLTAKEMAQKWNISSRMVAYDCKSGKIPGAIKKGKTWLLPVHAERPSDGRRSQGKVSIQSNPALQGALQSINQLDSDNGSLYRANDLYKNLGLTREALRYYEEIGLITPERNQTSQYREFTFGDVTRLMVIDFYKKRGFTPLEIRTAMQRGGPSHMELLDQKICDISKLIRNHQRTLDRLTESRAFCKSAALSAHRFATKELPLYIVMDTFDAVSYVSQYEERVLASLDLQEDDILSNLVRAVTFDPSGYQGTKMCIVKRASKQNQAAGSTYLESGECLHTILEADSHDDSLMEDMFLCAHQWAREHHQNFRGVVYIFIRFVALHDQQERNFYEVWIPLE